MQKEAKFIKNNSIKLILNLLCSIIFAFGFIAFLIQFFSSYDYFDVKTDKSNTQKMSGKIVFTLINDNVYSFAYGTANINVFKSDGAFLYSSKIPKDSKDTYNVFSSDDYFCIGTGINYENEKECNEDYYKFNSEGFIEKTKSESFKESGSEKLKVGDITFASDWLGNVYIENSDNVKKEIASSSLITNFNSNPLFPFLVACIGFIPLFIQIAGKFELKIDNKKKPIIR